MIAPDAPPPPAATAPAIAIMAQAHDAAFAPAADRDYRYISRQTRAGSGTRGHFVLDRRLRFARAGSGWRATLTITAVDGTRGAGAVGAAAVGQMFETAMGSLKDRAVVFDLDHAGNVVRIAQAEAIWATLCDAVAALGVGSPVRAKSAARISGMLRALPAPQRDAMLGSMLSPVVATEIARRGVTPAKPVQRAGRPPFGAGAVLTGTERIWSAPDGRLVLESSVAGALSATPARPGGRIEQELVQRVDRATGMLSHSREVTRSFIGDDIATVTTETSVEAAP